MEESSSRQLDRDVVDVDRRRWEEQGLPDALGMAALMSSSRVHHLLEEEVNAALRPMGLDRLQFAALVHLELMAPNPQAIGQVATKLLVSPARMTMLVDRLEQRDLVYRVPSPEDRRSTLLGITEEGRASVREAASLLEERSFGVGALEPSEAEQLVQLLMKVRRDLGDPG